MRTTLLGIVAAMPGGDKRVARVPLPEVEDGDLAVLRQLELAGSDLRKGHRIEFFL
jgi:hypothetical protein